MTIEWKDSPSTAVLPLDGPVLKFVEGRVKRMPTRVEVMLVKWPAEAKVQDTQKDEHAWTQVITVETKDRDGDVLRIAGADLKAWNRSMRVFNGHGWRTGERPIARGMWVRPLKSPRPHLLSKAQIWDGGGDPLQDWAKFCLETYSMIDEKFIEDASIGFLPLKVRPLERPAGMPAPKDGEIDLDRYHADIIKWILLEWSMVGVPSNPDANGPELTKSLVEHYAKAADQLRLSTTTLVTLGKSLKLDLAGAIEKAGPQDSGTAGQQDPVAVLNADVRQAESAAAESLEGDTPSQPSDAAVAPSSAVAPSAPDGAGPAVLRSGGPAVPAVCDPLRWNPVLSKSFDVAGMELPPSTARIEIVAKYLECDVKHICQRPFLCAGAEMGGYLAAFKHLTSDFDLVDQRNIVSTAHGAKESPPISETIQLNSKLSDEFLIEGTDFFKTPAGPLVIERFPVWGGEKMWFYIHKDHGDFVEDLLDKAVAWVEANNFLKGEKFSLSGTFLSGTGDTFDGLFLDAKNKAALDRTVSLLNNKGAAMANRGLLLMGPPGTGKTLSGRVMMNLAKSTFIWISSRDFYYCSVMGSIAKGFDMARKLAPCVLFIEDIDNWLGATAVDMLKTELDGVSQSKGVVTVLTTNFPEHLPKALVDRPGRFHDVLYFSLPDAATRAAMLQAWLEDAPDGAIIKAVDETDGYSGAHMHELAAFAKNLYEDDPDLDIGDAVDLAIAKVKEQRALIDAVQLQGSHYRPTKDVMDVFTKAMPDVAAEIGAMADVHAEAKVIDGATAKVATWKYCVCDACGHWEDHKAGDPCQEHKCPTCGASLKGSNEKPTQKTLDDIDGFDEKDIAAAVVALKAGKVLSRKTRERLEDCYEKQVEGAHASSIAADLLRELLDTADVSVEEPDGEPDPEEKDAVASVRSAGAPPSVAGAGGPGGAIAGSGDPGSPRQATEAKKAVIPPAPRIVKISAETLAKALAVPVAQAVGPAVVAAIRKAQGRLD